MARAYRVLVNKPAQWWAREQYDLLTYTYVFHEYVNPGAIQYRPMLLPIEE